jgi:hypothetical protein
MTATGQRRTAKSRCSSAGVELAGEAGLLDQAPPPDPSAHMPDPVVLGHASDLLRLGELAKSARAAR